MYWSALVSGLSRGSGLIHSKRESISAILFYTGLLTLPAGTRLCAGTLLLGVKLVGQDMSP